MMIAQLSNLALCLIIAALIPKLKFVLSEELTGNCGYDPCQNGAVCVDSLYDMSTLSSTAWSAHATYIIPTGEYACLCQQGWAGGLCHDNDNDESVEVCNMHKDYVDAFDLDDDRKACMKACDVEDLSCISECTDNYGLCEILLLDDAPHSTNHHDRGMNVYEISIGVDKFYNDASWYIGEKNLLSIEEGENVPQTVFESDAYVYGGNFSEAWQTDYLTVGLPPNKTYCLYAYDTFGDGGIHVTTVRSKLDVRADYNRIVAHWPGTYDVYTYSYRGCFRTLDEEIEDLVDELYIGNNIADSNLYNRSLPMQLTYPLIYGTETYTDLAIPSYVQVNIIGTGGKDVSTLSLNKTSITVSANGVLTTNGITVEGTVEVLQDGKAELDDTVLIGDEELSSLICAGNVTARNSHITKDMHTRTCMQNKEAYNGTNCDVGYFVDEVTGSLFKVRDIELYSSTDEPLIQVEGATGADAFLNIDGSFIGFSISSSTQASCLYANTDSVVDISNTEISYCESSARSPALYFDEGSEVTLSSNHLYNNHVVNRTTRHPNIIAEDYISMNENQVGVTIRPLPIPGRDCATTSVFKGHM